MFKSLLATIKNSPTLRRLGMLAVALAILFFGMLFMTGCGTTMPTAVAKTAPASAVPDWLEMKEGYAQTCIADGGCVPMSRRELEELVNVVQQKTMEVCTRQRTTW